jgi:hypothetical protein
MTTPALLSDVLGTALSGRGSEPRESVVDVSRIRGDQVQIRCQAYRPRVASGVHVFRAGAVLRAFIDVEIGAALSVGRLRLRKAKRAAADA